MGIVSSCELESETAPGSVRVSSTWAEFFFFMHTRCIFRRPQIVCTRIEPFPNPAFVTYLAFRYSRKQEEYPCASIHLSCSMSAKEGWSYKLILNPHQLYKCKLHFTLYEIFSDHILILSEYVALFIYVISL